MPSQSEIQESITARIIEGLQNGIVPWKKPWRNDPNCGTPANVVSRRNYSGINPVLLDLATQENGFSFLSGQPMKISLCVASVP
jgi:antirestriction protein ArdC